MLQKLTNQPQIQLKFLLYLTEIFWLWKYLKIFEHNSHPQKAHRVLEISLYSLLQSSVCGYLTHSTSICIASLWDGYFKNFINRFSLIFFNFSFQNSSNAFKIKIVRWYTPILLLITSYICMMYLSQSINQFCLRNSFRVLNLLTPDRAMASEMAFRSIQLQSYNLFITLHCLGLKIKQT